ncbi:hypothetical protein J3L18_22450 [Mucilaginibacter gossypii]|uniref:hypothetical protein n=1 Tax=Mucilaginibacter gossypii TaxID=551996 RepID=UPI000DCBFD98|nr:MULTISPECIES: hypothetical protein [Mucilaginibacter]QTE35887.1 hypothetical protein J3L18_22450 [Mucilaginibacter gossypii]RAV54693.1 hypothetical protein DIU36_20135 [Mucilaginibacter rubeus]
MKILIRCFLVIILIGGISSLSGCMALLELGEVSELGAAGFEVEGTGLLRIVSAEAVAEEISSVRMIESGDLGIIKNGRMTKFAELLDNNRIILENGKIIQIPGTIYAVSEEVFVRQAPFENSSIISSEHYSSGRLVIVNDMINGWYEIMLPNHAFGFIPANAVAIAHPRHFNTYKKKAMRQKSFHKGVNYIINNSFINDLQTKDMIVNITYDDGSFDEISSLKLNSIAIEKGYRATPSFFSKYYYIDELGSQLRSGNLTYINELNLSKYADYLLIGTHSTRIRPNQVEANMLTSDFTYIVNLVNLKTGTIEKSFVDTIHGNGWTDSEAREDASQAFYQIIKNKF